MTFSEAKQEIEKLVSSARGMDAVVGNWIIRICAQLDVVERWPFLYDKQDVTVLANYDYAAISGLIELTEAKLSDGTVLHVVPLSDLYKASELSGPPMYIAASPMNIYVSPRPVANTTIECYGYYHSQNPSLGANWWLDNYPDVVLHGAGAQVALVVKEFELAEALKQSYAEDLAILRNRYAKKQEPPSPSPQAG